MILLLFFVDAVAVAAAPFCRRDYLTDIIVRSWHFLMMKRGKKTHSNRSKCVCGCVHFDAKSIRKTPIKCCSIFSQGTWDYVLMWNAQHGIQYFVPIFSIPFRSNLIWSDLVYESVKFWNCVEMNSFVRFNVNINFPSENPLFINYN